MKWPAFLFIIPSLFAFFTWTECTCCCHAFQAVGPKTIISTTRRTRQSKKAQRARGDWKVWYYDDGYQELTTSTSFTTNSTTATNIPISTAALEDHRQAWIRKSMSYYSKVMREERRRNLGQLPRQAREIDDEEDTITSEEGDDDFTALANKHYFAWHKIRQGKLDHAELIYKRIINDLLEEEADHQCDHAKLAVTTLLLALLTQRRGDGARKTRSVFLRFFRLVSLSTGGEEGGKHVQCACSAKVVGAFALFEMKQGNTLKSLELAKRAFHLDPTGLKPLLHWKQFRDAAKSAAAFVSKRPKMKKTSDSNDP